ncbi:hypothetical protein [Providencia vermicola]|uniref:hypothetical protein n=1 Tax=Providencia vermicola TaxID=333965 RepID=UPI0032DAD41A
MELFLLGACAVIITLLIIRARNKSKRIQNLKDSASFIQTNLARSGYLLTKHGVLVAFSILEKGFSKYETYSWIAVLASAQNMKVHRDVIAQIQISKKCLSLTKDIKLMFDNNLLREDVFTNDINALHGILSIDENTDAWVERILSFDSYANESMVAELMTIDIPDIDD